MSFAFNNAVVNVSGNVTSLPGYPVPSADQTMKYVTMNGTGAWATLFTPTAGKTAYIFAVQAISTAGATGAVLYQTDQTTPILGINTAAANQAKDIFSSLPIGKVVSGGAAKFNMAATFNISVYYFEQ